MAAPITVYAIDRWQIGDWIKAEDGGSVDALLNDPKWHGWTLVSIVPHVNTADILVIWSKTKTAP